MTVTVCPNKDATVRKAMSHTVGDPYGIASAGIESFHAKYLLGFSGNIFERIYQSITMDKRIGDNVVCTVDTSWLRISTIRWAIEAAPWW